MMLGTPVYMPPEQCRGASTFDARSDIYTLGCVLFTMVCGRPPFESDATGDLIIMHVRDAPPLASSYVPGLPPELDAVIGRCLEKDPARRYQSTGELVQALAGAEAALFGMPNPLGAGAGYPGRHLTPAAALAYRQNPTPAPPDAYTRIATPGGPSPTTLNSATGAVSTTGAPAAAPKKRGALIAGIAVGVLAIGGGAFAVMNGGGNKTDATKPVTESAPAPAPVVTAPADAAVAAPVVAEPATPPIDAGVVEVDAQATAAAVTPPPVETKSKKTTVVKKHSTTSKGGSTKHGGSNASSTSTTGTVDRGD
jgi:serine/threonine-protein kinase